MSRPRGTSGGSEGAAEGCLSPARRPNTCAVCWGDFGVEEGDQVVRVQKNGRHDRVHRRCEQIWQVGSTRGPNRPQPGAFPDLPDIARVRVEVLAVTGTWVMLVEHDVAYLYAKTWITVRGEPRTTYRIAAAGIVVWTGPGRSHR